MSDATETLAEQVDLFAREDGDPLWLNRFTSADTVMQLGDKFVVNSIVTPRSPSATGLVAPEAINATGKWLAGTMLTLRDNLIRTGPEATTTGQNPAVLRIDEAESMLGFSLADLPDPYGEWRFAIECYMLLGTALYQAYDGFLLRYKVLTENECGWAFGPRLLPFLGGRRHEMVGPMVFLVGCPARLGALGGLRGYRRTFLAAGWAARELRTAAVQGEASWHFETEFYDDVAAAVLSVDGVERVPLIVGYQYEMGANLDEGEVGTDG